LDEATIDQFNFLLVGLNWYAEEQTKAMKKR